MNGKLTKKKFSEFLYVQLQSTNQPRF